MFEVQVGGGVTQLKRAPAGVEVSVTFVFDPEQILSAKGAFREGEGLIVMAREEVGPWKVEQLVLVP